MVVPQGTVWSGLAHGEPDEPAFESLPDGEIKKPEFAVYVCETTELGT